MTVEEENKCLTKYKKLFCTNCEADCTTSILDCNGYQFFSKGYKQGLAEGRKEIEQWKQEWQDAQIKANEEGFARTTLQIKCTNLEKEISVLLSCSNCPENKGGYICEKEYNDKCLAQKIEYIKELKDQNKDLCDSLDIMNNRESELLEQIEKMKNCYNCRYNCIENGEEYCNSQNGVCKRYSTNFDSDNWELAE